MELCRGGELFDQIVTRRQFSELDARAIMAALLQFVAHAHSKGIVHRCACSVCMCVRGFGDPPVGRRHGLHGEPRTCLRHPRPAHRKLCTTKHTPMQGPQAREHPADHMRRQQWQQRQQWQRRRQQRSAAHRGLWHERLLRARGCAAPALWHALLRGTRGDCCCSLGDAATRPGVRAATGGSGMEAQAWGPLSRRFQQQTPPPLTPTHPRARTTRPTHTKHTKHTHNAHNARTGALPQLRPPR
jgi:hypothetical protein